MAWGKSEKIAAPEPSAIGRLAPLIILVIVIGLAGFIAYHINNMATDIASRTSQSLEKRNVKFSKDGMKVGVKDVKEERLVDGSQSFVVKAWNYSKWPAYKSRFWNKEQGDVTVTQRKS
jgi:hypothetical protein